MAKIKGQFVTLDATSMQNDGGSVAVLPDPAGGLERGASGLKIAAAGVADAMLANSAIVRADEMKTITAVWTFDSLPQSSSNPTSDSDFARKAYVDSVALGLDVKASVRAATTANITLSGAQTIDGVSVVANDRVLVKDQSSGAENGIYVAAAGAWARSPDANTSAEVTSGLFVFVNEGTVNADSGWLLTTNDAITLDTTALTFVQFSGAGQITAGAGLTKSGNTIAFAAADASLTVNADSVQVNVDGVTIEVDGTNGVQVKAGGIDTTQLADESVTFAKMQHVATAVLLGRTTASAGDVETITLGSGLSFSGNTLIASATSTRAVETFTLDATAISNKYVTLAATPAAAGRVVLHVKHAGHQFYGDDFQMDGVNADRLTWDSLALDGVLASGDKLTVEYDT